MFEGFFSQNGDEILPLLHDSGLVFDCGQHYFLEEGAKDVYNLLLALGIHNFPV